MKQVVDASVILAYLLDEPGGNMLTKTDGSFCLSSLNLAEVLTKAIDRKIEARSVTRILTRLPVEHVDYSRYDAERTALLRPPTVHLGLSLGDRACLALGQRLALPVLTAERSWAQLEIGIDIRLIR